ncbi:hypothetical protein N657DRAFT_342960 [Parathielavia appendiculata]|uniref:Uncharacterized protein n=1 Tax=Parathielavia appendiculata TaxID=2587402 RepID=A0AAN6U288_9PEZI|nr:hypothetical protein N657DRAFT_342960 [Parathielavia appendiculata]
MEAFEWMIVPIFVFASPSVNVFVTVSALLLCYWKTTFSASGAMKVGNDLRRSE